MYIHQLIEHDISILRNKQLKNRNSTRKQKNIKLKNPLRPQSHFFPFFPCLFQRIIPSIYFFN